MPRHRNPAKEGALLTDDMRRFIVVQFAMFMTPQQVADAANEEFGLSLTRVQANRYNPDSAAGSKNMATKWMRLHAEVRAKYLDEVAAIPLAHRNARLKQLQIHYDKALARGNTVLCASLLEQIAKEVGNVHTNERKVNLSGKVAVEKPELSMEEMRNLLADRLAEVFEKDPIKPTAPGSNSTQ